MWKISSNSHAGVLVRLIEWVDNWKKLGIFIVLISFSFGGYLLYSYHKEIIFWALDVYGKPKIDLEKIDSEVTRLVQDTHADSVSVWTLNLETNYRVVTYLQVNGKRVEDVVGTGDVIFRHNSALTGLLIDLLNDDITCFNVHSLPGADNSLSVAGVTYACAVSIPPRHSVLIGTIVLGFKTPPKNEEYIRKRLRLASESLIR